MIAYFDCYSGISGDMTLGALVDAGVPFDQLARELAKLGLDEYRLDVETVNVRGIRGTRVNVRTLSHHHEHGHEHEHAHSHGHSHHRHPADIERIINDSPLSASVKARSLAVFGKLAEAEAAAHGCKVEEVHFHEVGAVDTIVDVVGSVIGLDLLGVEQVFCSPLPMGSGTITCEHGILPVPAPATLELCRRAGIPVLANDVEAELVTPTGAAIVATLATFQRPTLRLRQVGYGYGTKELPWPNALRVWVGEALAEQAEEDTVTVIETNIDDMSPQLLGALMDDLLAEGALDVAFQPIQMKKNRPAVKVEVIARPAEANELGRMLLERTTSLGVRMQEMRRQKCRRWQEQVATPWGEVGVKFKVIGNQRSVKPEYDDCRCLAREAGVSLEEVCAAATAVARARLED